MLPDDPIVLASNSPRRQELLKLTGWVFSKSPADIDESPRTGECPEDYVRRLAIEKAAACKVDAAGLILSADTIVADGNELLGKPQNPAQATRMLEQLRGRVHQVMTAIALFEKKTGRLETDLCISNVRMRSYTDQEIRAYVQSGDPLDKAGAYAIQHTGFHPVENFSGCFSSVMGLPLCHLSRLAKRFELPISTNMVGNCEKMNGYSCPIHQQVANGIDIG